MTAATIFITSLNTATVTVEAGKAAALIAALSSKGYQSMGAPLEGISLENGQQVQIDVIRMKTPTNI